jgi:uracil-DNA glycosylase
MHPSWEVALAPEIEKPYFTALLRFIREERTKSTVYPPSGEVFTAFHVTALEEVRVVLLGQDPYHNTGQAHGLSFSVKPNGLAPPSLQNIFKELRADLGIPIPTSGCLLPWAKQGVFLLNTVLTVRAHEAGSHQGQGWETFTDAVIRIISAVDRRIVFILWGRHAREKADLIDAKKHTIIESAHPSPMSADRGFFGSKPFSTANRVIESYGGIPIDWKL